MKRLTDRLWSFVARQLARKTVADWIIRQAMKTPYLHLASPAGDIYMERYWLLNPYDRETNIPRWAPFLPWSFRIHIIRREDSDRHLHDHPWNARTIILRGWYVEKRLVDDSGWAEKLGRDFTLKLRRRGDTAPLRFGEYHSITEVAPEGVVTLFISGRWRGVWGFLVDGVKVPWKQYLGIEPKDDLPVLLSKAEQATRMKPSDKPMWTASCGAVPRELTAEEEAGIRRHVMTTGQACGCRTVGEAVNFVKSHSVSIWPMDEIPRRTQEMLTSFDGYTGEERITEMLVLEDELEAERNGHALDENFAFEENRCLPKYPVDLPPMVPIKCPSCLDTGFLCVGSTPGGMHQPPEPIMETCHCDAGEREQANLRDEE